MKIIWFFLALFCIVGCSNYEKVQRKYLVKYNEYIYEIYSDSHDNALYYVIRGKGTPIFDVDFQPTITKFSIYIFGSNMDMDLEFNILYQDEILHKAVWASNEEEAREIALEEARLQTFGCLLNPKINKIEKIGEIMLLDDYLIEKLE